MFRFLNEVQCEYGNYWDDTEYRNNVVGGCIEKIGDAARLLLTSSNVDQGSQVLYDSLLREVHVDFSRRESGVDNEPLITARYVSDEYFMVVTYIEVEAFSFGQRVLGFSSAPDVVAHELYFDDARQEAQIEHLVLCRGADTPFFVRCNKLAVERTERGQ